MKNVIKAKYPAEKVAVSMLMQLVRCRSELRGAKKTPRVKKALKHLEILDALGIQ